MNGLAIGRCSERGLAALAGCFVRGDVVEVQVEMAVELAPSVLPGRRVVLTAHARAGPAGG